MLRTLLNDWKGKIEIDNNTIDARTYAFSTLSNETHIILHSVSENEKQSAICASDTKIAKIEYKITVKKYMTEKSVPEFDFMAKFNNDNPMPLRTMTGTEEKETRGMVYMKLHGQAEAVVKCMRCGRTLTNPISMKYGIGPECITKVPFIMDLDINDVDGIKQKLVDVTWEGWIIKSAITEKEEIRC